MLNTKLLRLALCLTISGCTLKPCPSQEPIVDERLIGTWRSDKERTVENWPFPKVMPSEQRERISNRFGKLRITYAKDTVVEEYDGTCIRETFTVLARDENSVVIAGENAFTCAYGIQQIIFLSPNSYSVNTGTGTEYFQRQNDSEKVSCTTSTDKIERLRSFFPACRK